VSEINKENERIERIEEERLTTADLAGAGQEERARDEATNVPLPGAPVEVMRVVREEGRNFAEPRTTVPSAAPSMPKKERK